MVMRPWLDRNPPQTPPSAFLVETGDTVHGGPREGERARVRSLVICEPAPAGEPPGRGGDRVSRRRRGACRPIAHDGTHHKTGSLNPRGQQGGPRYSILPLHAPASKERRW